MKVNKEKLQIAMAKACMNTADLQEATEMPMPTVAGAVSGRSVRPATVGKIARALKCDVTEIID